MSAPADTTGFSELGSRICAWHSKIPETIAELARITVDAVRSDTRTLPAQLEGAALSILASHDRFAGAGIVSRHPDVATPRSSMLWWIARRGRSGVSYVPLDADLTELGTYQEGLEDVEWYRVPATTGRLHMTGPFVDYMCTDEFALTFTAPITLDDEFLGVAGIDITVRSLEADLEDLLGDIDARSLLLANGDLVVLSLDPRFSTGQKIGRELLETYEVSTVPKTSLSIATPRGSRIS